MNDIAFLALAFSLGTLGALVIVIYEHAKIHRNLRTSISASRDQSQDLFKENFDLIIGLAKEDKRRIDNLLTHLYQNLPRIKRN